MNTAYEKLQNALDSIRRITDFVPKVALVLGSGLGDFAQTIDIVCEIPYREIEGMPVSTVAGHDGRFIFGKIDDIPIVCMKGRVHYYEGYSMEEVVMPVRLMKLMGAQILFLSNAAGGVNPEFHAGDFMMITDQISCFVPNPLIGENIDPLGPRFPDMSEVYNKELCAVIEKTAVKHNITLRKGVYTQLTGPSYESPTEIRMLQALGTDAVGMSTVVEAIAANHMGMKICGISCITNMAAGISKVPLSHEEVKETADRVAVQFKQLVYDSIKEMGTL